MPDSDRIATLETAVCVRLGLETWPLFCVVRSASAFDLVVEALAERGWGFSVIPTEGRFQGLLISPAMFTPAGPAEQIVPGSEIADTWREAVCLAVLEAVPEP